jgi:hypothetical protein
MKKMHEELIISPTFCTFNLKESLENERAYLLNVKGERFVRACQKGNLEKVIRIQKEIFDLIPSQYLTLDERTEYMRELSSKILCKNSKYRPTHRYKNYNFLCTGFHEAVISKKFHVAEWLLDWGEIRKYIWNDRSKRVVIESLLKEGNIESIYWLELRLTINYDFLQSLTIIAAASGKRKNPKIFEWFLSRFNSQDILNRLGGLISRGYSGIRKEDVEKYVEKQEQFRQKHKEKMKKLNKEFLKCPPPFVVRMFLLGN